MNSRSFRKIYPARTLNGGRGGSVNCLGSDNLAIDLMLCLTLSREQTLSANIMIIYTDLSYPLGYAYGFASYR